MNRILTLIFAVALLAGECLPQIRHLQGPDPRIEGIDRPKSKQELLDLLFARWSEGRESSRL